MKLGLDTSSRLSLARDTGCSASRGVSGSSLRQIGQDFLMKFNVVHFLLLIRIFRLVNWLDIVIFGTQVKARWFALLLLLILFDVLKFSLQLPLRRSFIWRSFHRIQIWNNSLSIDWYCLSQRHSIKAAALIAQVRQRLAHIGGRVLTRRQKRWVIIHLVSIQDGGALSVSGASFVHKGVLLWVWISYFLRFCIIFHVAIEYINVWHHFRLIIPIWLHRLKTNLRNFTKDPSMLIWVFLQIALINSFQSADGRNTFYKLSFCLRSVFGLFKVFLLLHVAQPFRV